MKQKIMDMGRAEIQYALKRAGFSQADIARAQKKSFSAVCRVISGKSVSHDIRTAIAEATGIDIKRIWPSTYIIHGGPRKPGRPSEKRDANRISA